MDENRYNFAGWVAITQAILLIVGFLIAIIQGIVEAALFKHSGPNVGPSDLIMLICTGMTVYTLLMFRNLLNERYNFHQIDTLIIISICLAIIFQIGILLIKWVFFVLGKGSQMGFVITSLFLMISAMISSGIVDILIAVKLLKIKNSLTELVKIFTYLTLITGIMEVTVLLSPLAFLLFPVSSVILGMIFFKEKEMVEFV
jgi:hypothetical protein